MDQTHSGPIEHSCFFAAAAFEPVGACALCDGKRGGLPEKKRGKQSWAMAAAGRVVAFNPDATKFCPPWGPKKKTASARRAACRKGPMFCGMKRAGKPGVLLPWRPGSRSLPVFVEKLMPGGLTPGKGVRRPRREHWPSWELFENGPPTNQNEGIPRSVLPQTVSKGPEWRWIGSSVHVRDGASTLALTEAFSE